MRSQMPERTSGSASLAKPGSTPFTKIETPALSAAAMTGAAMASPGSGYCSMTGLDETTLMPAARKRSQVGQRLEDAVVGHGGVHDAVGLQREQRVDVTRCRDAERAPEAGQLAGVAPDLVGVGDEEPDQLEVGVGVDAGDGVAPDVAGAPLHDAVGHAAPWCSACSEVGDRHLEIGRLQAAVDLDDLAGDVGAGG